MLLNLHIKNMALIDEIDIDFSNHLNILTGETGAGKSIVIDSIMLALGGKTPKDFVRKDADYGLVELVFSVEDEDLIEKLSQMEIPDVEEGQLVLSKKVMGSRSVSKINGETVTLSKVRDIAALLLDLHAQHEHQSLLIQANHKKLLDRYGQKELEGLKSEVASVYKEYAHITKELADNSLNEEEKKRQLDLIEYELQEIESAALKPGEDELLEEQYKKASNGKSISDGLAMANQYIMDGSSEAVDRALRVMMDINRYDSQLTSMTDCLSTVSDLLSDFSRSARDYLEENSFSEEEFQNIENRLNLINHLKAKYGKTIDAIKDYASDLSKKYENLQNREEYMNNLLDKKRSCEKELEQLCERLSLKRKAVAKELTGSIKDALIDLNFLDVRFDMIFEKLDHFTEDGYDNPYFIISTNVGEEMKPLWQVASGGELSRIMLAMKSCLADVDKVETLIFDEIDVGISGRTAQMVAEKIHRIGRNHQVICITHLPQIAAMATHHYLIEKNVVDNKTITSITKLDRESEIRELARLIGGVEITPTVLQSAKEMKELASKAKVN